MKKPRKIIQIDDQLCDGCGRCVPSCAEGALQIINGKARVVSDNLCDGLGACLGECPTGALKIIERPAEEFDEHAVEAHLAALTQEKTLVSGSPPSCGCPSAQIQSLAEAAPASTPGDRTPSALSHWPIQIRLVPAHAPFLKNAEILVLADCAAVAHTDLHASLLPGKIVMMGCPKFDDTEAYIQKFTEIFSRSDIRGVTVVSMEVPCCSGLPWMVKKALAAAKTAIPVVETVIDAKGREVSRKQTVRPS